MVTSKIDGRGILFEPYIAGVHSHLIVSGMQDLASMVSDTFPESLMGVVNCLQVC